MGAPLYRCDRCNALHKYFAGGHWTRDSGKEFQLCQPCFKDLEQFLDGCQMKLTKIIPYKHNQDGTVQLQEPS
jgi:hypothetical protein